MQYDGLAWAFALLALLAALVAVRILFERTWFLGWLRGTCGLAFVAVAALLLVLAWDLRSYSLLKPEQPMATLSFQAEGPQRYRVLIQEGANERSVVLDGELWQLDARIFRWKGLAALIGLAPGYRLDALSGRFLALEQQSRGRRLGLSQSPLGVDLWRWLRAGEHDLFLFEPLAGRGDFPPLAGQAGVGGDHAVPRLAAAPRHPGGAGGPRGWGHGMRKAGAAGGAW
uniref:hypothetical protein n=1 Tax=Pseudomonas aeruginosa TaxID=287 RepID=UPI003D272295